MKQIVYTLIAIMYSQLLLCQNQTIWILLPNEQKLLQTNEGNTMFENENYANLLHDINVNNVIKAFPYSKTNLLRRLYEISCSNNHINFLTQSSIIDDIYIVEEDSIMLYTP